MLKCWVTEHIYSIVEETSLGKKESSTAVNSWRKKKNSNVYWCILIGISVNVLRKQKKELFLLSIATYGCMPKLNDIKQTFIVLAALWVRNLERVQPGSWSPIRMASAKVAGAKGATSRRFPHSHTSGTWVAMAGRASCWSCTVQAALLPCGLRVWLT